LLHSVTLAAVLVLWADTALAQEEEPSAPPAREKAEPSEPSRTPPPPAAMEESDEAAAGAPAVGRKAAGRPGRRRVAPARATLPSPGRAPIVRDDTPSPAEPAPAVRAEAVPKVEIPVAEQPPALPAENHPAPTAPAEALPAAAPATPPPVASPQVELAPAAHGGEPTAVPAAHSPHGEHGTESAAEHGEGHGEHAGFSVKTFVLQLLNFGVLLFLLIRFGGPAMNKALRARHDQLKGDIGEAARLRDEAKQKFDAQEHRVAELEKEISALRESMRRDAEQEQARMEKSAHERAKRMQEEMRIQLEEQVKVAESLLRAEVANASVKLAEELIRKAVNSDDERRLAREFVAGFDAPDGPGGVVR
jgi:F-type H+-transporting ATPase subunit b